MRENLTNVYYYYCCYCYYREVLTLKEKKNLEHFENYFEKFGPGLFIIIIGIRC